jgi:hypothetical protein
MGIFDRLKNWVYLRTIRNVQSHQHVERHSRSYDQSHSFCIITDQTSVESRNAIEKLVDRLRKEGKQVKVIFFTAGENPAGFAGETFIQKEVKWYNAPPDKWIEHFAKTPYDVLINLCIAVCPPIDFLSAISIAHLRIGSYQPETVQSLDLMIDIGNNRDMVNLISQLDFYLKRINKG